METTLSYSALVVSNFFLRQSQIKGIGLTTPQLNLIVYIAHGLYLANNKGQLIDEPVEVWNEVPVVRNIYYSFEKYQTIPIEEYCAIPFNSLYKKSPTIDLADLNFFNQISEKYCGFFYSQLSSIACGPGNPAELFNVKNQAAIIPCEAIKKYFKNLISKTV